MVPLATGLSSQMIKQLSLPQSVLGILRRWQAISRGFHTYHYLIGWDQHVLLSESSHDMRLGLVQDSVRTPPLLLHATPSAANIGTRPAPRWALTLRSIFHMLPNEVKPCAQMCRPSTRCTLRPDGKTISYTQGGRKHATARLAYSCF